MNLLKLALPGWVGALLRASPWIAIGLLIAAVVVKHNEVIQVTGQRDRIIHVIDPSGKTTPDQAIVAAQRVLTERDAAKTALTVTTANYRLATTKAQAADLAHARAVEARDALTTGRMQHDLETQLAGARADADRHARSLRADTAAAAAAGTDRGSSGAAGVPGPANAAGGAAGARAATELDDSRACAAGVTLAEGWQRWWAEVTVAPR